MKDARSLVITGADTGAAKPPLLSLGDGNASPSNELEGMELCVSE